MCRGTSAVLIPRCPMDGCWPGEDIVVHEYLTSVSVCLESGVALSTPPLVRQCEPASRWVTAHLRVDDAVLHDVKAWFGPASPVN